MLIIFARHSIYICIFYIIGLMRNGMGNGGYLNLADL